MDAPDPEKSLRYWQNLAMDDLVRAQTPQQRKKKIKSCIKLIYDTGTQLERLGSECVVAVGSAAYGIYVKVWGFGKSADKCLDDFNNNGVSLKRALESRAQIDLLASNAATLLKTSPETQNIADTNTNTEPLTQKALPLEELIRRDKRNEVKQMLALIPNLSTTPILDQKATSPRDSGIRMRLRTGLLICLLCCKSRSLIGLPSNALKCFVCINLKVRIPGA